MHLNRLIPLPAAVLVLAAGLLLASPVLAAPTAGTAAKATWATKGCKVPKNCVAYLAGDAAGTKVTTLTGFWKGDCGLNVGYKLTNLAVKKRKFSGKSVVTDKRDQLTTTFTTKVSGAYDRALKQVQLTVTGTTVGISPGRPPFTCDTPAGGQKFALVKTTFAK